MEQKLENKTQFKDRLINFYNINKVKIFILIFILISILASLLFMNFKNEKENILISEKYIEAGLNLSLNKKNKATSLYEEVIISKNKFYSILAFNTLIEKDLINDEKKILKYFAILENLDYPEGQSDLILFKKALYLLKISKSTEGKKYLKYLIEKKSKLKLLAEELIPN